MFSFKKCSISNALHGTSLTSMDSYSENDTGEGEDWNKLKVLNIWVFSFFISIVSLGNAFKHTYLYFILFCSLCKAKLFTFIKNKYIL